RFERPIESEQLAGELLPNAAGIVAGLDAAVALEQVDHRQIARRLAIGDRAALQYEPPLHAVRVAELPHEPALAHAGLADQRHELAVAAACLLQCSAQRL